MQCDAGLPYRGRLSGSHQQSQCTVHAKPYSKTSGGRVPPPGVCGWRCGCGGSQRELPAALNTRRETRTQKHTPAPTTYLELHSPTAEDRDSTSCRPSRYTGRNMQGTPAGRLCPLSNFRGRPQWVGYGYLGTLPHIVMFRGLCAAAVVAMVGAVPAVAPPAVIATVTPTAGSCTCVLARGGLQSPLGVAVAPPRCTQPSTCFLLVSRGGLLCFPAMLCFAPASPLRPPPVPHRLWWYPTYYPWVGVQPGRRAGGQIPCVGVGFCGLGVGAGRPPPRVSVSSGDGC